MPSLCEFNFQDDQHRSRDEKHNDVPARYAEHLAKKGSYPRRFVPQPVNHLCLVSCAALPQTQPCLVPSHRVLCFAISRCGKHPCLEKDRNPGARGPARWLNPCSTAIWSLLRKDMRIREETRLLRHFRSEHTYLLLPNATAVALIPHPFTGLTCRLLQQPQRPTSVV